MTEFPRLGSRWKIVRGGRADAWRDAVLDQPPNGLFAIVSASGPRMEAELATRAVCEILRRSVEAEKIGFADAFLVAEEALTSILGVLGDDADQQGRAPVAVSFAVALVADGWAGVLTRGGSAAFIRRDRALYRLEADQRMDGAETADRKVVAIEPGDRLVLLGAGLSSALDERALAAELAGDVLEAVDRLTERHAGAFDVGALAVAVDAP